MQLEHRIQELSTLNQILEILNQEANFSEALQVALEKLVDLLSLTTGWVFLTQLEGDAKQSILELAAYTGLPPALAKREVQCLREGGCTCQGLFRRGELDTSINIVDCSRLEAAKGNTGGLEVHASVPLFAKEGPVGILNLASPGKEPFDAERLEFLTAVGRTLGLAFRRARLQEQRLREREALAKLEERARLAIEIHHSVAQLLLAADLSLRVAKESEVQREGALARSASLVNASLSELRGLDELLRPAANPLLSITPKERQVLMLLSRGLTNKLIARDLGVAEKTIKTHVSSLLSKLQLKGRTQAALWAKEQGL